MEPLAIPLLLRSIYYKSDQPKIMGIYRFGSVLFMQKWLGFLAPLGTKRNAVKRYHKFLPNIPPKCRGGNIFWSSCSPYDKLFIISLYKYICPEGWDTWLPRMSGTLTNDMELSTLSQKRQNRTTCNLVWSCQWIWLSSAPLNRNGPRLFQLPKQG